MFRTTLHNTSYDKSIYVNGKEFAKFKIWDTSGSKLFMSCIKPHINECQYYVFVFDPFHRDTIEKLDDFIRLIRENTDNWYSILVESQINYQWKDREVSPEESMVC